MHGFKIVRVNVNGRPQDLSPPNDAPGYLRDGSVRDEDVRPRFAPVFAFGVPRLPPPWKPYAPPRKLLYCSFGGPGGWQGAIIRRSQSVEMLELWARANDLHPGGDDVIAFALRDDALGEVEDEWTNRLLERADLARLDVVLGGSGDDVRMRSRDGWLEFAEA